MPPAAAGALLCLRRPGSGPPSHASRGLAWLAFPPNRRCRPPPGASRPAQPPRAWACARHASEHVCDTRRRNLAGTGPGMSHRCPLVLAATRGRMRARPRLSTACHWWGLTRPWPGSGTPWCWPWRTRSSSGWRLRCGRRRLMVWSTTSRAPGRGSWWTGGCNAVSAGTGSVHNSLWRYIRRNEQVNPLTAELLDRVFARGDDGSA